MEHIQAATIYAASITNPFNNVLPNFSIFGAQFTQLWQKLLGALWALCLIGSAAFVLIGFMRMSAATSGGNPAKHQDARNMTIWALIAFGACAAIAVIVGAILAVVS
ncbi:hypothetical protein ACFOYW_16055 [Gryllotalpicola reticulitermitis]|uniref:Interferon-induced transmembrane protein n=1 Tax=Gryllotalpicola reticulitermitis TaxID=1184153 RepID=A0ABV8QB48_9MICO